MGVEPDTRLAVAAGLKVDDGVVVDASLRTSDPDVFAAGDVARAYHPLLGTHIRVEHWANALNQPAVAAAAMLDREASYDRLPYFYTDQYDLGMEYTGYVRPGEADDVVIRGDLDSREYIAFWLAEGRVVAEHERQRLGRHRRHQDPDPRRGPGRPGQAGRPGRPPHRGPGMTRRPGSPGYPGFPAARVTR
ncbi:FAD-dependent oxidoreductase [Nonomuraea ferruginea]